MHNIELTKVALRYKAVFLDVDREAVDMQSALTAPVLALLKRLTQSGFTLGEELLHALNVVPDTQLADLSDLIGSIMGADLNWAPLVKGWQVPTGESLVDHLLTWFANQYGDNLRFEGTTLPCGHLIPDGTFALERYNGCPICGTPFETAHFVYTGQGSKLKELRLFTRDDLHNIFVQLLTSSTPLDATQTDSLTLLLKHFELPAGVQVPMRETAMLVIKSLVDAGRDAEARALITTPVDVLRYLWYEKTGYARIIEPKTLIAQAHLNYWHIVGPLDSSADAAAELKHKLRLKYNRAACRRIATWLNAMPMSARRCAEAMHPRRGMWVRMIRALRLGEYARRDGFSHLAEILDVFYRQDYNVWQGRVNTATLTNDADTTLSLLKERPGLFARCLFATMLRFGPERAIAAFNDISHTVPSRLLLSLSNAAQLYFANKHAKRTVHGTRGTTRVVPVNPMLSLYSQDELQAMAKAVDGIYIDVMKRRFAAQTTGARTIYIDPQLYNIPVSVGDRATTIQDTSSALMGTRFDIEGDSVRLFLQWGKGLPAQHLDMDLSCAISLSDGRVDNCAYYNLTCTGARHSGDIRAIPDFVGTAEYIELSLPELEAADARYVTFTCNAYSCGALNPNLVVGWMNSAHPMQISPETGVAYDPSCVQHMVRISNSNLAKGLVFGVLDVARRQIIWLEMPFQGQTLRSLNPNNIASLLARLEAKITVGDILALKAQAQHLQPVDTPDLADEPYTYTWALSPALPALLLP